MNTNPLTLKQIAVLQFMAQHHSERGSYPTHAEMARRFGWTSGNAAICYLKYLNEKGMIERFPGKARGYMLTPRALSLVKPAAAPQRGGMLALPVYTCADLGRRAACL